jgi:acetylornithine deacetylase
MKSHYHTDNEWKIVAEQALSLLKQLIAIKSYSGQEEGTASLLENHLQSNGYRVERIQNNVLARGKKWTEGAPVLLLNSHHDTVQVTSNWDTDPFEPVEMSGKLHGLGSNDAGAPLVCLLHTFYWLNNYEQPYNVLFLASAEEETSGTNGFPIALEAMGKVDLAVVGEPTSMEMAVSERGLIVLDVTTLGESGHAARGEGVNALYKAVDAINWFRNFEFDKVSDQLGKVSMNVTQIKSGTQHNVIPDTCQFVVDVRPNDCYTNTEIVEIIRMNIDGRVNPRSLHLNSSGISNQHSVVLKAKELGILRVSSKTMSDQAHMPFPSIKIGPGNTQRSHTPNEFIYIDEILDGVMGYAHLLNGLDIPHWNPA